MQNTYPTKLLNNVNNSTPLVNAALTQTQKAFLILYEQENINDFYYNMYKKFDTATQMLFHMEFFVTLFEQYRTLLKPKDDAYLPLISTEEYKKMPKIYRGAFKPYSKEHYILRTHNQKTQMILSIKKTEKMKTKFLFDEIICLFSQSYSIENINKLYSIFAEIDKNISLHKNRIVVNNYKNDPIQNRHGAWDIFTEYQNELTHKNFYHNVQKQITAAKIFQINKLKNSYQKRKALQNLSNIVLRDKKYFQIIIDTKEKVLKNMRTQKIL